MHIQYLSLDKLIPYSRNARKNDHVGRSNGGVH
jgi:hypothetical protein